MSGSHISGLVGRLAASRRALQKLVPGTIRFDNGDPDFNTPEPIRAAHAAALAAGFVHYADPPGDRDLRVALAEQVSKQAGRTYASEQILVTHGATAALAAAFLAVVDVGDGVLMPEPTYSLYPDLVAMAGGRSIFVPTRPGDFHLDLDALEKAAPGARVVVICSPSNPTGAVYTRAEMEGVARIAERHDLVIISDEAYDHITYAPTRFVSMLEVQGAAERLIYIQSFSKTYSMTGWRLGYLAGPLELVVASARVHRSVNGPVASAGQRAALAALSLRGWQEEMLAEYTARRSLVVELLRKHQITVRPPEGAFYALVPHPRSVTSVKIAEAAAEAGVAVRPGSEYGPSGEGYVRVAFSVSRSDLAIGLDRLGRVISSAASA